MAADKRKEASRLLFEAEVAHTEADALYDKADKLTPEDEEEDS
jgi:hypothetical protein